MAHCIKTGAWCFVTNYQALTRCDIHQYRDVLIVRFNSEFVYNALDLEADLGLSVDDAYIEKSGRYGTVVIKLDEVNFFNEHIRSQLLPY